MPENRHRASELIDSIDWRSYSGPEDPDALPTLLRRLTHAGDQAAVEIARELSSYCVHGMGCDLLDASLPVAKVALEHLREVESARNAHWVYLLSHFSRLLYERVEQDGNPAVHQFMRELLTESGPLFLEMFTEIDDGFAPGLLELISHACPDADISVEKTQSILLRQYSQCTLRSASRILRHSPRWPSLLTRLVQERTFQHEQLGQPTRQVRWARGADRITRAWLLLFYLPFAPAPSSVYEELARLFPSIGEYELNEMEAAISRLPGSIQTELFSRLLEEFPGREGEEVCVVYGRTKIFWLAYRSLYAVFHDQRPLVHAEENNGVIHFIAESIRPAPLLNALAPGDEKALRRIADRREIWEVSNNLLSIFGLPPTRDRFIDWLGTHATQDNS